MQTAKQHSQRRKPPTPPVKQLPLGWLAIVTIFYMFIGKLFFHQLDLGSDATFFFNSSWVFTGVIILTGLAIWVRNLILTLVKIIVAAKVITRAIALVSLYFLIFSILANDFVLTSYILVPCYSGFALLALLWVLAVTATQLLVKFSYIHTGLILLGVSLFGLGLGAWIGRIHHAEPLPPPYGW